MADDYNDYRFESQSKTSRDFVLANGDVISVINAGKAAARPSARKRAPYLVSGSATIAHATGGEFTALRTGSSAIISVFRSFNGMPSVSNDKRFLVQKVGAPRISRSISAARSMPATSGRSAAWRSAVRRAMLPTRPD